MKALEQFLHEYGIDLKQFRTELEPSVIEELVQRYAIEYHAEVDLQQMKNRLDRQNRRDMREFGIGEY